MSSAEHHATRHSAPPREHGSPLVRALFLIAGLVSLGGAVAGVFLPVLPTTPLVLLAAACFARSYRPFHEWLTAHRLFGPLVREWHEHRSIPYRTKLFAIGMMAAALAASVVWFVDSPWLKAALAVFGVLLGAWLYSLPSSDR